MMYTNRKEIVLEKLKALTATERMTLMDRYARQTENIYCTFSTEKNINIITKIFILKFDNDALVDAYKEEDTVVDHPGCRFYEFLNNEMTSPAPKHDPLKR
ncbi:MAG: hypothetical protein AB8I52_02855 [Candidatus Promineifilaceae bacterium]|jgi:hypothetical protein